uniref:Carboxylesterase type B domain-containing protein n=1 Tax=Plectus sambesii TaxID=2011161 RepID=A0A914VIJ4_9BILA
MNVFTVFLALSFLYVCANGQDKDWTKLTLKSGAIRGRKVVTARNTTAFLFQGIPFAEPPTGDLRFRAPVAKKAWKGELLTNDYKFTCLFTTIMVKDDPMARNMSEDCLHMNVFTTEKCLDKKNCPVLYYIHGGSWNFDSPFLFADDFLIDNYQSRDIVLVTLTYRMGSFGFFNTVKKSSADKNLGLLGQSCHMSVCCERLRYSVVHVESGRMN